MISGSVASAQAYTAQAAVLHNLYTNRGLKRYNTTYVTNDGNVPGALNVRLPSFLTSVTQHSPPAPTEKRAAVVQITASLADDQEGGRVGEAYCGAIHKHAKQRFSPYEAGATHRISSLQGHFLVPTKRNCRSAKSLCVFVLFFPFYE